MNFKYGDIVISEYGSIGIYHSPNNIRGYSKCWYVIDRCETNRYVSVYGLKNVRLASKSEIKRYFSELEQFGKLAELKTVKRLNVSKDEF